jgi:hypothetical protein
MTWKPYKQGHLARSKHAYYFVYPEFDHEQGSKRWFTECDPRGADQGRFSEEGILIGEPHGFESLEAAQEFCEKDAEENKGNL